MILAASIAPSPFVSISPSWFTFGLILVVAFAWTRPLSVRDFEGRKLPVNATAQLVFALFYCLAYLTLVLVVHYARPIISHFFASVGAIDFATRYLQPRADASGGFAPLFSLTILCWFQSISMLREVERTALVYVYSARYQFADVRALGSHLVYCNFLPTADERAKNRMVLERLNVFLTDSETRAIDLQMITDWRKVETLLRHLDEWKLEGKLALTKEELLALENARTAHERKTSLALNIVRMLDHLSKGGGAADTFHQVTDLLETAHKGDRSQIEAAEARVLEATEVALDGASKLRLSSGQLKQFLGQVESYFNEEYRLILEQVSELTAKAIVHAPDRADERLQSIKRVGFEGIGELLTIKFDRILLVFAATFFASLLLFLFRASMMPVTGTRSSLPNQQFFMMIVTISLTIAFATIVGAFVGSTRELAQSPRTPWLSFGLAGLLAVFLFFVVHATRAALTGPSASPAQQVSATVTPAMVATPGSARPTAIQPSGEASSPARPQAPFARPPTIRQSIPWALVPFLMTIGICLLARIPNWPVPARWKGPVWERLLDGLALAAVMVIAMMLVNRVVFPAFEAFPDLDIRRSPAVLEAWKRSFVPVNLILLQIGIGFVVGAMVVRDVRRAGHSRIVDSQVPRMGQPNAQPIVKALPLPGVDAMPAS